MPSGKKSYRNFDDQEIFLNDNLIRLIGIPFFGISIPNLTGLFGDLVFKDIYYWLGYPYFILLAASIWQGNRYLLFRTRKRLTWFDRPLEKIVLLIFNNIFFTAPLTILAIWLWYVVVFGEANWEIILVVTLVNVICVLFVTHVYETVFLIKQRESDLVQQEQLQRARAEAELVALRNQIDPHFMFNSLNTLAHLITADTAKALKFTESLAEIYRYILTQKDHPLVLLQEEINFAVQYSDILKLRFGKAFSMKINLNNGQGNDYLIPPISVFVALENAVKHNEISARKPLQVSLDIKDSTLMICNLIQTRKNIKNSTGIGLKNLDDRFEILTGQPISFTGENGIFEVCLPLLPLHHASRSQPYTIGNITENRSNERHHY